MFTKSIKKFIICYIIFLLAACGGGRYFHSITWRAWSLLDPPSGGTTGSGGSGGNVKTGTCPDSEFIQVGSPVAGNNVCAIQGPITGELNIN